MTSLPPRKHYRRLKESLLAEGFEILQAWTGTHLRVRVARNGREATVTLAGSPGVVEHAVANTVKQALKGTR